MEPMGKDCTHRQVEGWLKLADAPGCTKHLGYRSIIDHRQAPPQWRRCFCILFVEERVFAGFNCELASRLESSSTLRVDGGQSEFNRRWGFTSINCDVPAPVIEEETERAGDGEEGEEDSHMNEAEQNAGKALRRQHALSMFDFRAQQHSPHESPANGHENGNLSAKINTTYGVLRARMCSRRSSPLSSCV
ncbi:PREDICTED: uncharacterized protein LOC106805233 [Priapulus caudatus]|uniref:Uncharacterized protein LOC106805233 n=1 Tax=Priapulus caudatus TaxID=37621 RepID=A0ABM1DQL6_PRICU|nr:PREDICTED: uncharacterized protein LOC106805233 [Priapulus caudatus]